MTQIQTAVTFVVGVSTIPANDTCITYVYSEDEYSSLADIPNGYLWRCVTVASEEDKAAWIEAKNDWLWASWAPQAHPFDPIEEYDERQRRAQIRREAEQRMKALEIESHAL